MPFDRLISLTPDMPKTAGKPAGNDKYTMKTMTPFSAPDGMPALN